VCKDKIAKEFCQGVFAIAGAFAINHPLIDASGSLDLIYMVLQNHSFLLPEFTKLTNAQAFFNCFKIVIKLPEEAHEDTSTLLLECQQPIAAGQEPLKNLLYALFVQSWNAYLTVKVKQQQQLELQEFLEASLKDSSSTAPIAMMLDGPTPKLPKLQEFLTSATTNQTKIL
jgi:hypothetical protein